MAKQPYEIVDLEGFVSANNPSDSSPKEDSFLSDLIPHEDLYQEYLNGRISFTDLMREMHRKESVVEFTDEHTLSSLSDDSDQDPSSDDPDYEVPRRHKQANRSILQRRKDDIRKQRSVRRGQLPVELSHYLGEAERLLNNDKFDEAEEICKSIISSAPNAAAPHVVLAELFHRRGDEDRQEKAIQHLVRAAKLDSGDASTWHALIEHAEAKDDYDIALVMYYTRQAMNTVPEDASFGEKLIELNKQAGKTYKSNMLRLNALLVHPKPTGQLQFEEARFLSNAFFKLRQIENAIGAYVVAFQTHPNDGTEQDRSTLLSMMIQEQQYEHALEFFTEHCGVELCSTSTHKSLSFPLKDQNVSTFDSCKIPTELTTERRLTLFLVLTKLGFMQIVTPLLYQSFTPDILTNYSDWLIDIVKAYKNSGSHNEQALDFLTRMTHADETKELPSVWIMLAQLHTDLEQLTEAISCYRRVIIELAPRHIEARLALVSLVRRTGQFDEALELLKPSNVAKPRTRSTTHHRDKVIDDPLTPSVTNTISRRISTRSSTVATTSGNISEQLPSPMKLPSSSSESASSDDDDYSDGLAAVLSNQDSLNFTSTNQCQQHQYQLLIARDPVAYRLAFERCRALQDTSNSQHKALFMDETWAFLYADVARVCGSNWANLTAIFDYVRHKLLISTHITKQHNLLPSTTLPISSSAPDLAVATSPVPSSFSRDCRWRRKKSISLTERRGVGMDDLWALFLRLLNALEEQQHQLALPYIQAASTWACTLPMTLENEGRRRVAANLMLSSSLLMCYGIPAFSLLKVLVSDWSCYNQYWNAINIAIKFCKYPNIRLLERSTPHDFAFFNTSLLHVGQMLLRNNFKAAVDRLLQMIQTRPKDPLLPLLCAASFANMACHSHVVHRHSQALQTIGLLGEYRRNRGLCQEVYYNIARACHQLMLSHIAISYYEKVISMEPTGDNPEEKKVTDLSREAAFNLMLIYKAQGNFDMARHIVNTHIVI